MVEINGQLTRACAAIVFAGMALRSKNLRRSLALANNLLEALGRNFSTQKS